MPAPARRSARRSASSPASSASRVSGRARRDSSSLRRGPRDRAVSLERPMNPLLALAPPIAAALVRLLGATLRLRAEGVEMLAAITGAPVVPLGFAARPAWRLATWDEFQIPSPFARAALVFGAMTSIARDADRERARKEIERGLDEATAAADRLVSA